MQLTPPPICLHAHIQRHNGAPGGANAVAGAPGLARCFGRIGEDHPPRANSYIRADAGRQTIRPSDWAERLAGAMSCLSAPTGAGRHRRVSIGHSPLGVPRVINGVSADLHEALRGVRADCWDF